MRIVGIEKRKERISASRIQVSVEGSSWAEEKVSGAGRHGTKAAGKLGQERCPGTKVLGQLGWERRSGMKVLGQVGQKRCPGTKALGRLGWRYPRVGLGKMSWDESNGSAWGARMEPNLA
jgi:hypothetical protein